MACTEADRDRGKRCSDNKKEIIEIVETQAFQVVLRHEDGTWGRRAPAIRRSADFAGAV